MRRRPWCRVLTWGRAGRLRAVLVPLLGALALALPFVLARFEHHDRRPQLTMGVAGAWLGLDVVQAAGTAYGIDKDAGLLRTISGATYKPAQLTVAGPDPTAATQVVSGGNVYVYPTPDGRIARVVPRGTQADLVAGTRLPANYRIAVTGETQQWSISMKALSPGMTVSESALG